MSTPLSEFESPERAWIFDFDGVLTDLRSKRIENTQLIEELLRRLDRGEPIAANTGRSLVFAEERFLDPLERAVQNRMRLRNVFLAADKGGTWRSYDEHGERWKCSDEALLMSEIPDVLADIRSIVEQRYARWMFFDGTKETTITVEMNDLANIEEFHAVQPLAALDFDKILRQHGLRDRMRIDMTQIAIDIEWLAAGKGLGVRRILNWLQALGIEPESFVAFGDSKSDLDMGVELANAGRRLEFVFVGDPAAIERHSMTASFPIVLTKQKFDKGTLEFLQSEGTIVTSNHTPKEIHRDGPR